jgi:hypothetical protein
VDLKPGGNIFDRVDFWHRDSEMILRAISLLRNVIKKYTYAGYLFTCEKI